MAGGLIGRRRELAAVDEALGALARGHGGTLVVTGEAGIGKSRFAREVAMLARGRDFKVVWAAGWPAGGAPSYWPWPEIVAALDPAAATALEAVPERAERERFDRFREVASVLWEHAASAPLVVIIDDAHTVDADGLLLTRFVAQSTTGHAVLLVLAQRTAPAVPSHTVDLLTEIARTGTSYRLGELTAEEVADLLALHGETATPSVVQRVSELSGGVPFLVELVLDAGLHRGPGPVPDPARRLAGAWLAELRPGELDTIEAAAVLGAPFTPSEVALLAGLDADAALDACCHAAAIGLLRAEGSAGFAFRHDLAREAVLTSIPSGRLAALHHGALQALAPVPASPELASRRARHALELARCNADLAPNSIDVVRDSAAVLRTHGAPEAAARLLEACLELDTTARGPLVARLLVELGDALLATGRLGAARDVFRRAVDEGDGSRDPITLAEAALGLGGVWVLEHRSAAAWRTYLDVLDLALAALAPDTSERAAALRASLRLRVAVERAAVGDATVDEVLAAVTDVRACGTPRDVLAGLSLLHHLMLGPEFAHERRAVADEAVALGHQLGDDLHLIMGLLWQTADDLLLGRDAGRTLVELRTRADALGMRAILFIVDAFDVMLQLRAGELAAAEAAALVCQQRGVEAGDTDADNYLAAHLLAAHWYRGTAPDLLGLAKQMTAAASTPANNPVFTAAVAAIAAEAGDLDTADQALDALGRGRLDALLRGSTWLVTMFAAIEAAAHLSDAELAAEAYDLLRPYEELPIMTAIGVACFGSAARSLGVAARTCGRLDAAVTHFEHAVAENQRLGNRPMTAIARAELAGVLLQRHQPGDLARASTLIARALDAAEALGLTGRVDAWRELQRRIEHDDAASSCGTLQRRDGTWWIAFGDEQARLPASAGLAYLARLLDTPGVDIPVGALAGVEVVSRPQEVLDATARASLRRRIAHLESAIDAAVLRGHTSEAERLQLELDALLAHLRSTVGPAGPRSFDDPTERARTSVQKALRRAIRAIGRDCPRLAEALQRSVSTGYRCRYEPQAGAPERWNVRLG